jgi:hypothetical protein
MNDICHLQKFSQGELPLLENLEQFQDGHSNQIYEVTLNKQSAKKQK